MKASITIISLLLTQALVGQVNDTDAFFNGHYDKAFIHKHKIKQATVEAYIDGDKASISLFYFDKNGLLTKQTILDSNGKKANDYTFTYNAQGDQTERKNIAYDLNQTYTASFTKTYEGSQLVQEKSSELPFVTKHVYNNKSKRVQSTTFLNTDITQGPKRVFLYTYDTRGRLKTIQETYLESNTAAPFKVGTTEYIYDAAGNVTTVIREGKPSYNLSYDKNGLLKSRTVTMPEDLGGMKIVDKYNYSFRK